MVDIYIAATIAFGFGILTYWWGKQSAIEPTIGNMLEVLEKGNYIKVKIDKDGEKELVRLNETV